jgi:site-specific recombinase XerD
MAMGRADRLGLGESRARYVRWLQATKDLSPHTVRAYEADLSSFEGFAGADLDVAQIDGDTLIGFLESQKSRGLSPASLRRRASALRGFCRWLRDQGLLDGDPWNEAGLALSRTRSLPRALPAHQLDRLIEFLKLAARAELRGVPDPGSIGKRPHESTTLLAVSLMVATGVRVHEAVGIRCQDIDLPARSIRLVGKGRRERQVFLTNGWITDLTSAYLKVRSTLGLQHPRLLFNLHHDPLTPPAMRSRLAKAAAAAGLEAHVTPHMLRHTAATQLIEAGVDIRYIQRLLGHASLSTTELYTHVSDGALRRVVSEADVLGRFAQAR